MERADFGSWVDRYERLWRTPGVERLDELFTADARYLTSPWDEPLRGLAALARLWEAQREGPDEQFSLRYEVVAVDGDLGVVRAEVDYANGDSWLDLWLVRLDADGRCTYFEEWPLAQPRPKG